MRGLYIDQGKLTLRDDLPEPEARAGWSRVAVTRAGICATDQALLAGYMGFAGVPGHEFVGVALDGPFAGKRVVGEINAGCGRCALCRAGDSRHCKDRTVLGIAGLGGAFAERIALPNANLLAVPDGVSDDAATFTEPLAAALHIREDVAWTTHRRVLVVGDGKLGLLCAAALASGGHDVTLVGRSPRRVGRAALLGPPFQFVSGWFENDASARQAAEEVDPFDVAVEASGSPDVLSRLLPFVRPQGVIVLKTTTERGAPIDLSPLVVNELRLIGSRCGRFEPALSALSCERIAVEALISARYPLTEAAAAFEHAGRRGTLKVLLDIGESP